MSPTYLVGFSDSSFEDREFGIVNAPDTDDATLLFIQVFGLHSDEFIEYVYDKSVDGSLAEHFWVQTEEEDAVFSDQGEVCIDDEEFRVRVLTFFTEHSDFAERYLDHYFRDQEEPPTDLFPDEMLLYIWLNADWAEIEAIPLDDIVVI
jgi:hypothetical protein